MNQVKKEIETARRIKIQIVQGDITTEEVDAIVNAANKRLQHGGGVAGAISRRGGPSIQAESDAWVRQKGSVSHETPAVTGAGSLPCRYVIHAVGPVWDEGNEDAKLEAAVLGSLKTADELQLTSISMPAISTGIYGFPIDRAARIILKTIRIYFDQHPESILTLIRLVLFDDPAVLVFLQISDETNTA
ncbi:MAG: macro domain-containing protein [Chloroflexi bacterium]|nr:MAG: macro domain-containing protein [Chloroflexota bacterium]